MKQDVKIENIPPKNPNKRDCIAKNITFPHLAEMEKLIRIKL